MREFDLKIDFETVDVTGRSVDISSFSNEWRETVTYLAKSIAKRHTRADRLVVAIAGPSGSSKSTTAQVLATVLQENLPISVKTVGLDGYHYPNKYLEATQDDTGAPLSQHKGRFDTYDVATLTSDLESYRSGEDVAFPAYSRVTHEPVPGSIEFHGKRSILIIEGLWLLFDVEPWAKLTRYYDFSIFFNAAEPFRRHHTISRHLRGNKVSTLAAAETFYDQSDSNNTEQILDHIAPHDVDITVE